MLKMENRILLQNAKTYPKNDQTGRNPWSSPPRRS